jgi:hypothetical protein
MTTRLSTIAVPGRNYGSFSGKAVSVTVDIDGRVTLLSATPVNKLRSATNAHTNSSATPKHTVR